ncbi:MAG TPA: acetylornithine deacetylase [Gemmatimonadota bacterium]|nr:acetylornithine deacetylase [Gemmatimonadota bacterium]
MPAPDSLEILSRMVALDTTSEKSNLPLVDLVCERVDRVGVRTIRQPTEDGEKANLVVVAGPEGTGRDGLVLCGHTDTVPATEPGWRSDPWTLTEVDGRLVGRGAADMKGFLALAVEAFAAVDPARLEAPLALLFTHDEEVGTLGARRFVESGPESAGLPRRTIVGEPTGLRAVRMHKGHVRIRIEVRGVPAHSAYPHLGRSAIEPAARAIAALAALREELAGERPEHAEAFEPVPFVPLNVGRVAGGVADNVVPDRCAIDLGLRPLPGMAAGPLVERVREAVAPALDGEEWSLELVNESPPAIVPADTDLYRWLVDETADGGSVSFATDAGWLQRAGFECVVWGPGSIEVAHKPNEWVPVADLDRAREVLARAVARWCGGTA